MALSTPNAWYLDRRRVLTYSLIAAAIIYLPSLAWTFGHDQYVFAEIGSLMLQGKAPYIGAWDIKPPNIYYLNALAQLIFGQREIAIRIFDYISVLVSCGLIFSFVDRIQFRHPNSEWRFFAPALAAILLALTALSLGLADTAQTETFSLPWIIGGVLLVTPKPGHRRIHFFTAGFAIAMAAFFKTTNGLFLLPVLIAVLYSKREGNSVLGDYMLVAAGFAVGCGLELGALWMQGSLHEYLRILENVRRYHADEAMQQTAGLSSLLRAMWVYVDVWLVVGAFGIILIARRNVRAEWLSLILPLVLLTTAMSAVLLQKKGWGYHFVVMLPGLISMISLLASSPIEWATTLLRARARLPLYLSLTFILFILAFVSPSGARRVRYIQSSLISVQDHARYRASIGDSKSAFYLPATDSLAQYLIQKTSPGDRVFILGQEPGAYWLSRRTPATRYIYGLLFTSQVMRPEDFASLGEEVTNARPAVIAVETVDTMAMTKSSIPVTSAMLLRTAAFERIATMLNTDYALTDTVFSRFLIYRRKA